MVWPSARRGVHPAAQDHAWPRSGGGCRSRRWSRSRRRGRRRRRIGTRQGYRKQREYDCLLHAGCAGNLRSSAKAMKYARSSATATKRCGCSDKSNVAAAQRDGPESLICSRRLSEAKGKCQKAKARSKQDVHVRVRVIRAGTRRHSYTSAALRMVANKAQLGSGTTKSSRDSVSIISIRR